MFNIAKSKLLSLLISFSPKNLKPARLVGHTHKDKDKDKDLRGQNTPKYKQVLVFKVSWRWIKRWRCELNHACSCVFVELS